LETDDVRLAEILTTAAAVADFLSAGDVTAAHLLAAIAVLRDGRTVEELGRPLSPLVRRPPGLHGGAAPAVRELAQRWYAALGSDLAATMTPGEVRHFEAELHLLVESGRGGGPEPQDTSRRTTS